MAMGSFYRVGSGLQALRMVKLSLSFNGVRTEGPKCVLRERLEVENVSTRPKRSFAAATTRCAVARSRISPAIASTCSSFEGAIDRDVAATPKPSLR
jgi:hypothetical protein